MVRANKTTVEAGTTKRKGWGRSLVRGVLQGAVVFAVISSVPEAMGAGKGVVPGVAASGKVSLHVDNVPVGTAKFSNIGAVTTVRTGAQRTVINYSYLNVGAGATLNFLQPTSSSQVLNRISGATPTRIDGAITSNGAVWLVNPGGVYFGKGAVINTGQFVAAASHITDASFLSGSKNFTGAEGSVVNRGTINAQEVHLTGLNVANFGTIAAGQGGVVTMTSGKDVYIGTVSSPASAPLVMVKMSGAAGGMSGSGTGVVNAGSVRAPGGTVRVGAGDLFAAAIYNSGTVQGSQVAMDSGKGTNISTGTIDASNAAGKGGTVELLGRGVKVTGTVDASGSTGGGDVRIGGDFHGEGSLPTSEKTVVTGTIHADATESGAGGTVVLWSEKQTVFSGTITAAGTGGSGGGAGGNAEVSSHGVLDFNPTFVDMGGGQLLLDPITITIQDANPDINGDGTTGDDIASKNDLNAVSDQNGKNSIITSTALNGLMTGGGASDVTLSASTSISINTSGVHINTGTKTLTLNSPTINIADIFTGTVTASGNVTTVHVTGNGANLSQAVSFTPANRTLIIEGGTYTGTGGVTIASNITVLAANGTVVADGWSTSSGNAVTMSGGFQSAGNIALAANTTLGGTTVLTGGNISISGPVTGANNTLQLVSTGDETITSTVVLGTGQFTSQGVNFSLSSGVLGANNITLSQTGNVTLTSNLSAGTGASGLVTIFGKNITTAGITGTGVSVISNAGLGGTVTLGSIGATTAVVASADGDVSQAATTTIQTASVQLTSNAGNVTLGGANVSASGGNMTLVAGLAISGANVTAGNLSATAGTTINLTGGTVNAFTGASNGAMAFTNAGGLTVKSANSTGHDITLADTTGAVNVTGNVTAGAGNVSLTGQTNLTNSATVSGANVSLVATTGAILGTGTVTAGAGDSTLTAATNITTTSGTVSGTNVTLTATAGTISGNGNITAGTGTANLTAGGDITVSGGSVNGPTVVVSSTGGNVTLSENYTATGNLTVTAQQNVGMGSVAIAGGNVTLAATTGGISGSGNVTATGTANLTASGNIFPSGGSVSGGVVKVTSTNGGIQVNENYTATAGNATLSVNSVILNGSGGVVSGNNVVMTSTGGGIGVNGSPIQFSTSGQVVVTTGGAGHTGDIFVGTSAPWNMSQVTATTDTNSVQLVSVASGGALTVDAAFAPGNAVGFDDVALKGTTVTLNAGVTGGTVNLTSTTGGITGTSGVTATTLNLTSAGGVTLTGNAVTGTVNATANGSVSFTNAGGFSAGNISSGGNDISLRDTTGAVSIAGTVTAGAGNATVRAATNITDGGGTVTGAIVTLIADTGSVGSGGSSIHTTSGSATADLVVTGANVFVTDTHAIDTTNVTATLGAGGTLNLTASSISLTSALVSDPTATVVLTATTGGITGTTGSIAAANVTLNSAAGINVANVTATSNLSMTAVGANITLTEGTGTLDLGVVHVTDTAGRTVTLNSPAFATSTAFAVPGLNLVLNATQVGGTTTVTNTITAESITLIADDLVVGGGVGLLANPATGTLQIEPFSAGRGLNLSASPVGGVMNVDPALLVGSTAKTVVLGGAGMTGTIFVDNTDLSTKSFGLTLQTTGALAFTNGGTLTLANNATLTITGVGGVNDGTSTTAVKIGGGAGTIDFVGINGDIGTGVNPLTTQVSILGGVTGSGTLYLSNTGGLTVSGVVNTTGGTGDGFIAAHSPLTVSADISVAGNFTLSSDNADLTIDNGATFSSTNGGTLNLVVTTAGSIFINDGTVATTNGKVNVTSAGNISLINGTVAVGSGTVAMGANGDISLTTSNVTAGTANLTAGGNLGMTGSGISATNVTLTATTGNVTLGGGSNISSTNGNVTLLANAIVSLTNSNVTVGTGTAHLSAGGDLTLASSTVSATGGKILLTSSTGNVTLNLGNVLTGSGNVTLGAGGAVTMGGTASQLTAGILVANSGTGVTLDSNLITAGTFQGGASVSGDVLLVDQGGVAIAGITTAGGNVSITAHGNVTQTAGIVTGGGNLTVQTRNAGGSSIALTSSANQLGTGLATLQVRDAAGAATVSADVQFRTATVMNLQQVDAGSTGNVTLTAGTGITQSLVDGVGVHGSALTVNSAGDVGLTNTHNAFNTLTVTDTNASASHLAFVTNAAGGLTVAGFAQTTTGSGATASIVNQTGGIGSGAALTTGNLSLTATGGVLLSNAGNLIPAITVTNNVSGAISVLDGMALTILGSTQNAVAATTFTGSSDITVAGNVAGGNGTTITTGSGHTLTTSGANIADSSFITLKADGWVLDPTHTITGPTVTVTSATATHAITLDGSVGTGLSNGELDSIHAAQLAIGDSLLTGGITSGTTAVSFGANVSGGIKLVSAGGISLASTGFTTNGTATVSMQHTGVLTLANGTFGGTFTESAVGGSGAGGTAQLSGALQTTNKTVTFNSQVQLAGTGASVSTVGTTGANITFGFSGGASVIGTTAGGQGLTLSAGTSTITFAGAVGTAGTPIGVLTVNSVGTLSLPTVFALGENLTHSGVLTVSGVQTLGGVGFLEGGTGSVALGANISSNGVNVFNSPAALGTSLTISGTSTAFNGTLTGNGHDLTVNGNGTFATVNGIGNVTVTANASFATINGATSVTVNGDGVFGTTSSVGSVHVVGNGTFTGSLGAGSATIGVNGIFNTVNLTGALQVGQSATFNGPVNAGTVSVGGVSTVATGTITTTGNQTYSSGVILSNDATLSGTTVAVGGAVTGNGHNLTIGQDAVLGIVSGTNILHVLRDATFGGAVNTGTLLVDRNAIVNTSSLTSAGTLTVSGSTNLGTSTTLSGTTVSLIGGVTGNGNSLTVGGDGVLGPVNGVNVLHVTGGATLNTVVAGSVAVDGTTAIDGPTINTTGTQLYGGTVTLNIGATLTGTTVTFGSSLDGQGHDLTVAGNGVFEGVSGIGALHVTGGATFGGAVGSGTLTVDGASTINTPTITTAGTQTYAGAVALGMSTALTGTTVTFGNSVIGSGHDLTVGANGVFNVVSGVGTLHDLGGATFNGAVSAGALVVDGGSLISTSNITTTGNQTYAGGATLTKTVSLTGSTVTLAGLAMGANDLTAHGNAVFGAVTGTGDLHVTGTGTFAGNVSAATVLVDGTSVLGANIVTTGNQTYTGNSAVAANSTLTGNTVKFSSQLATGSKSLTVDGVGLFSAISGTGALHVAGPATFGGTVSEGSLVVDGGTTFATSNITTTGTQTYTGAASVGQTLALTGSTVTFGTVNANGHDLTVTGTGVFGVLSGMRNLTVTGSGNFTKAVTGAGLLKVTGPATFAGAVNAQSVQVSGTTTVLQTITTPGDQSYGKLVVNLVNRDVTLQTTGHVPSGSTGSITVNGGISGTGSGVLTFQTDGSTTAPITTTAHEIKIAGNVDMPAGTLNILNGGVVQFAPVGGTGQTVNAAGISFQLPGGQKAVDQIVATIFDTGGDLTFTAGAGGFFMGHGETMTVFNAAAGGGGNLKIVSTAGNITLGDLTVLGDIDVDSGGRPIAFQAHGNISLPQNTKSPNPFTQTTGVVSDGTVTMNGPLTIPRENVPVPPPLNFKNEVWFSVSDASKLKLTGTQLAQGANGTSVSAQFFSFSQSPRVTVEQLNVAGQVLYAPADGSAPAFALQSSVPRDVQTLQPERAATVAGTMLEDLQHLGVNARAANKDELLAYLLGDAIYNDIPMTLTPAYKDMRVAANRLPNSPILPTVTVYRKLFFEPVVDANGAAVKDKDGQPMMRRRGDKIQAAFEVAWEEYTTDEPKGTPEGFRAFLESKKSDPQMATALDYLNQMRSLLVQIRSLGLTDTEFNLSKGVLFREVQPQNIASSDVFLSAIMGTTQAAKQNVPASPKAEAPEENSLKNVTAMR